MKQFLLPILTLLSFCAYAQKPATHDRGFSRLQLGVNVSPDICYRRLASPDGTNAFDSYIRASNDEQVAKLGFTGGFGFCLNFSRIVGLETGLRYANMGYRSKEVAFGSSNPKSPISGTYSVSYEYLEIPVKMNFTIGGGDIRFIGSAGLAASLLMEASSTSELTYADRKTTN